MDKRLLWISMIAILTMVTITMIIIFVFVYVGINDSNHDRPLIIVSLDGFRPDYLSKELTPNLFKLFKEGCSGVMRPVFTSETFPNHFSIATGLYAESHGVVSNSMFDPLVGNFFKRSNSSPFWWDNGYATPIWIANQIWSDGKSGTLMWPGSSSTYRGYQPFYNVPYTSAKNWTAKTTLYNKNMDKAIEWIKDPELPANLVMIYFNEPDDTSHRNAPFSEETNKAVAQIDEQIGLFVEKLKSNKLLNRTNLMIISDHGMATVRKSIDLLQISNSELYTVAKVSTAQVGIWPQEGKYEEVLKEFKELEKTYQFKVYEKKSIPWRFHYRNNRRIAPILLLTKPGYELCTECWKKEAAEWGNHGYDNEESDMRALFIGHGPDFRKNFAQKVIFNNVDLYPIMLKLLHIPPHSVYRVNGTLKTTDQFLRLGLRPDNQ